jgi:hypothetical protein
MKMAQFADAVDDRSKVMSVLTAVEGSSALCRLRKSKFMSLAEADLALKLLSAGMTNVILQPVNPQVLEAASILIDRHYLRAMDAVQLGSAVVARDLMNAPDMRFIASDKELLAAALAEGFDVWDPSA